MPQVDREGVNLKPAKAPEFFKVKCNVHPWMSAWVGVFDHPYHTVTGDDGRYELDTKGLPDGDYEVMFWHEKYKDSDKPQKVTIKKGKATAEVDYAFVPPPPPK